MANCYFVHVFHNHPQRLHQHAALTRLPRPRSLKLTCCRDFTWHTFSSTRCSRSVNFDLVPDPHWLYVTGCVTRENTPKYLAKTGKRREMQQLRANAGHLKIKYNILCSDLDIPNIEE